MSENANIATLENKQNKDTNTQAETKEELKHDPINGTFEISVDNNFLEATLIITPPYFEGKPVTEEMIQKELTSRGIVFGVDNTLIKKIIRENLVNTRHIIAKGIHPQDGINGTITYLFEKKVENIPKEDEKGFVNYRDLGLIRNIKAGTHIAKLTFPTDGVPGTDIRNAVIPQKKGISADAPIGENVGFTGDGSVMIALVDGNLKYAGNKFAVETVFNMKGNVDSSTGNLEFIGDIIIRGEVLNGFKVTAQKSITIYENATGATIEAGGDIVIKKGCINTKVVSHGNVTIDFVENSNIACDGDLKGDAFLTSTVYCGGELTASGKRGYLMGGKYTCLKNLTANSIGTKSYMATVVTVGDNAIMLEEKAECERKIKDIDNQILRCTQAVDFLTQKKKEFGALPPEKVEILNNAIKQKLINQVEKSKVEARIADIIKYLENKQNLSITCRKELYPGTRITINDFVLQVKDIYQYCRIYLDDDGIKTETL